MPEERRFEGRLLAGLESLWGKARLTVLAYHRIRSPAGFAFFEPVISATPSVFARQMDMVVNRFNPISLADLLAWIDGDAELPPRAVLITFDDGYRDNLEHALPILRERELPAVLFLPTEYIGGDRPFFWDSAAYSFHHTDVLRADLPILGLRTWASSSLMCREWVAAAKREPEHQKNEATKDLARALGVAMPETAYSGEILTWDEVRTMAGQGFSFGSHTLSHPILTQLPPSQAFRELAESRQRLQDELKEPIRALAYPNGGAGDFSPSIEKLAKEAGYSAAFTLVPGPERHRSVQRNPLAIRRIAVYLNDTDRRWRAKLAGGGRIKTSLS